MRLWAFVFVFFTTWQATAQQDCMMQDLAEAESRQAMSKVFFKTNAASQTYDVKHYDLRVYLDPRVWYIQGNVTIRYTTKAPAFQLMELDFVSTMQVDSVIYHGNLITFQQQPDQVVKLFLPAASAINVFDSVRVFFRGIPNNNGLGSFSAAAHSSGHAIWSLSQPYGSREWWPNKMTLDDKADSLDVTITTPQQYRGASSGMLVSDTVIDTLRTVHWQHRYPIATYLIAVAASNYLVYADYWVHNSDSLQILNYVYPHSLSTAQSQTPFTVSCMELFANLFEDYPFRKERYGHAQFGRGGGMEHQTMSFLSNFSSDLIAHELAHQWFGDKLTCGTWLDIWLNEGFATYLTGLTYENLKSASLWRQWKTTVINTVCDQPGGSVYPADTTNPSELFNSRLTYLKGAFVLHMLRYTIGDQAFFKGIKNYLADTTQAYKFSSTAKLKQHLETASDRTLTYFFDQWYYKQGFPTYTTEWMQQDDRVTLQISQSTSHASVPFFIMPLQYWLIGGGDTLLVVAKNQKNKESFNFQVPFKIDTVIFDPFLNILSKGSVVINKRQLMDQAGTVKVYPNPTSDILRVVFRNSKFNSPVLQLFDVLGQQVAEQQLSGTPFVYDLDLRRFSSGHYTLRIVTEDAVLNIPVIKQ